MRFVETPIFTRELQNFLKDEDYRTLQLTLLLRPEQGKLISGSNGLRKLRWGTEGKGKQKGCRIIYYWEKKQDTIYMLLAYPKGKQESLTSAQIKVLSRLVREEFK
jgi:mRNA-degrading endonuclease RelE of RelBE toxin-antitoxin system